MTWSKWKTICTAAALIIMAGGISAGNLAGSDNVAASEKQKELANLFDGNFETRWSSYLKSAPSASFTIDLGENGKFNAAYVFAKQFKDCSIQVSGNRQSWKDIGKLDKFGESGYGKFFQEKIKARYVRLNINGEEKESKLMLYELGVLDISGSDKALYKNIIIKDKKNYNWRYPIEQAVDGNPASMFRTYSGWTGGEVEIDLGKTQELCGVELINTNGIDSVKVSLSDDGKNWKEAATATEQRASLTADFSKTAARYIKLNISSEKKGVIGEIVVKASNNEDNSFSTAKKTEIKKSAAIAPSTREIKIPAELTGNVALNLTTDPDGGPWQKIEEKNVFENKLYELHFSKKRLDGKQECIDYNLRRKDGKDFKLVKSEASVIMDAAEIQKIWPTSRMCQIKGNTCTDFIQWGSSAESHACSHDPLIMALRSDGSNLLTMGMLWTVPETRMRWKPLPTGNGPWNRKYRLSFSRPIVNGLPIITSEYRDGVFLSKARESWYDSIRSYVALIDKRRNYVPRKPSKWSLSPCLSIAWTLFAPIDKKGAGWAQKMIEKQIPLAKSLGFGIVHLDIDFESCYPDKPDSFLYHRHEDAKFTDFKELIKKLGDAGMIMEMHYAVPILLPGTGRNDAETRKYILKTKLHPQGSKTHWGDNLCPRTQGMADRSRKVIKSMIELGIKSFWIDFCDDKEMAPLALCTAQHEHKWSTLGEGWDAQLKAITETAWAINPEITFIARRSTANIHNKPYLTHGCSFDCEYDLAEQRREAIFIRSFGPGLIPYTFHGIWADSEPAEEVARHMASYCLLMVPVVAADLTRLTAKHIEVIKAWLQFYRKHAEDIIYGDLKPLVFMPVSAAYRIERNHKAFISCFELVPGTVPLTGDPSEIYLFNSVTQNFSTRITGVKGKFKGQWLDHLLKPCGKPFEISTDNGALVISSDCKTLPCMLKLTRE